MRYLRYLFLAVLGAVLIALALANREVVVLRLLSDPAADLFGIRTQIGLPLFVIIFVALVAGILVGLVWEWFREHGHRAEASAKGREAEALRRDLNRLRSADGDDKGDDVLAILDGRG